MSQSRKFYTPPWTANIFPEQARMDPGWRGWFIKLLTKLSNGQVALSGITVGASPFIYTPPASQNVDYDVAVTGGTVSAIAIIRQGVTITLYTSTNQTVRLSPGDMIEVTYSAAPTMTLIPR